MPLYDYTCTTCGHVTTELQKQRATEVACAACRASAYYTPGATAAPVVPGGAREGIRLETSPRGAGYRVTHETDTLIVREKGVGLTHYDFRCVNGHDHGDDLMEKPTVPPDCPVCGAMSNHVVLAVADAGWFEKEGPYFDVGLGRYVESREHRRRIMKELGVVEHDWKSDIENQIRADSVRAAEEDAVVREMLMGYEYGPDAAELKRARDRGEVEDWTEHAKALGVIS